MNYDEYLIHCLVERDYNAFAFAVDKIPHPPDLTVVSQESNELISASTFSATSQHLGGGNPLKSQRSPQFTAIHLYAHPTATPLHPNALCPTSSTRPCHVVTRLWCRPASTTERT